jgi:hypothetical protein
MAEKHHADVEQIKGFCIFLDADTQTICSNFGTENLKQGYALKRFRG